MNAFKKVTLSTVDKIYSFLLLLLELFFPREFNFSELESKVDLSIIKLRDMRHLDSYYFFSYKEKIIKDAVWELKFKNKRQISKIFAGIFCAFLREKIIRGIKMKNNYDFFDEKLDGEFILIPIPIHKRRRSERGFNQCEWLCEDIIKILRKQNTRTGQRTNEINRVYEMIKYEKDILIRNEYTQKQSWSSRAERLEKLKGVFEVREKFKSKITGKKIILVDDVTTTGATIKEARRTLLESGASLVISVVIAH